MTDQIKPEHFWDRLDDVNAGMLNVAEGRPIPMSHYADRDGGSLWFITARGTDLEAALRGGAKPGRYIVASGSGQIYANVEGELSLSMDKAKLDELWNAVADAWFEGGESDPDVQLVKFTLREAEVWATPGNLGFLYQIAKAQVTDEKPDMGEHGTLKFAA